MTTRTCSFFKVFKVRQALIPLSTITTVYREADSLFKYLDVYVFGFRVARFTPTELPSNPGCHQGVSVILAAGREHYVPADHRGRVRVSSGD